ncbi:hypothetical protein ON010_g13711 [Phytophthora cinnamomi]|nr:hypothetical protein ON010_g13711 [Phytophthora cinnamomi]
MDLGWQVSASGETSAVPVGPNREGTTLAQVNKRRHNSAIVGVCSGDPHLTIFVCSATPHGSDGDRVLEEKAAVVVDRDSPFKDSVVIKPRRDGRPVRPASTVALLQANFSVEREKARPGSRRRFRCGYRGYGPHWPLEIAAVVTKSLIQSVVFVLQPAEGGSSGIQSMTRANVKAGIGVRTQTATARLMDAPSAILSTVLSLACFAINAITVAGTSSSITCSGSHESSYSLTLETLPTAEETAHVKLGLGHVDGGSYQEARATPGACRTESSMGPDKSSKGLSSGFARTAGSSVSCKKSSGGSLKEPSDDGILTSTSRHLRPLERACAGIRFWRPWCHGQLVERLFHGKSGTASSNLSCRAITSAQSRFAIPA